MVGGETLAREILHKLATRTSALLLAAIIIYLLVRAESYYLLFFINVLYFATIVLAWNIIGGYAGQLDLASAAYLTLGGIVSSLVVEKISSALPSPVLALAPAILTGGIVSCMLAMSIGFFMFKFGVREVWYALSTAAIVVILNSTTRLLIGPYEYYLSVRVIKIPPYDSLYFIVVACLTIVYVLNNFISNSRIGFYLRAIREDELAAEAVGIDTRKYKLLALALYSFVLGSIGFFYIVVSGYFYTYRFFDTTMSVSVAILGIIGGLGSPEGCLLSAIILKSIGEYLRASFATLIPGLHLLLYGLTLIAIGVFEPEGIAGLYTRMKKLVATKR